jgi:predicted short-subunit dehydrogenase-like oxidoreductase (DUF2520 family)
VKLPELHLIGAGKLAWSIAQAWKKRGGIVGSVWARNQQQARLLAEAVGSRLVDNHFTPKQGVLLLAIKDDALAEFAGKLTAQPELLVLHAAGSQPLDFMRHLPLHGCLWPLQQLLASGNQWETMPLLLEAGNKESEARLCAFANVLSSKTVLVDYQKRQNYHLAAVWAGNFSQALFQTAYSLLETKGLDPTLLKNMLQQQFQQLFDAPPYLSQTGPARRNDVASMQRHLALMENRPDLQALYQALSSLIQMQARDDDKK